MSSLPPSRTPPYSVPTRDVGSESATGAMVFGALSFGAVSVLAYSIWAFRLIPGTAAMYATTAIVYLGLGGLALGRLLGTRDGWKRLPLLFGAGFLIYALCWCAFWFGLKGKYHADLWGAAVGLAAMTWLMLRALHSTQRLLPAFGVLFTCHTLGYTLGGELYALVHGSAGRLLWGAGHGLGFGAGLGFLLYHCRPTVRNAVTSAPSDTSGAPSRA